MKFLTLTRIAAAVLTASVAISATQVNAFGLGSLVPGGSSAKSTSNVSANDIDSFIKTADEASALVNTAANYIYKALGVKEETAKYEEAIKAANALTDPKEKEAKLSQAQADRDTSLKKILSQKETEDKVKQMNADQQKQLGNAGFTFMLGLLKDKELAEKSSSLLDGVADNPMLISKLPVLKNAATSIMSQVKSASSISEGLAKISKAGNLSIMPTSSADKPKPVTDI